MPLGLFLCAGGAVAPGQIRLVHHRGHEEADLVRQAETFFPDEDRLAEVPAFEPHPAQPTHGQGPTPEIPDALGDAQRLAQQPQGGVVVAIHFLDGGAG